MTLTEQSISKTILLMLLLDFLIVCPFQFCFQCIIFSCFIMPCLTPKFLVVLCLALMCCVCRVYLVQGSYPEQLIRLWDSYAKTGQSQNDRPGIMLHHLLGKKHVSCTRRLHSQGGGHSPGIPEELGNLKVIRENLGNFFLVCGVLMHVMRWTQDKHMKQ